MHARISSVQTNPGKMLFWASKYNYGMKIQTILTNYPVVKICAIQTLSSHTSIRPRSTFSPIGTPDF